MANKQGEVDRRYAAWRVDANDKNTADLYRALEILAGVIVARRCKQVDEVLVCELAANTLKDVVSFKGRSRFSTWAHRAIWRDCNDAFRKRDRNHENDFVAFEDLSPKETQTAIGTLDSMENKILLNQLTTCLSALDGAVLWGKLEGYEDKEIAEQLGLTAKAVERRWAKIPDKLGGFVAFSAPNLFQG